jgi:lysophosphatidate acyltransferase
LDIKSSNSGSSLQRVPWGIWALIPVILQAIFRRRGGYIHRNIVAILCVMVSALYGVAASITLPIIGKTHLINWSVGRFHKMMNRRFLDIDAQVEGTENFAKHGQSAIYVCNHQTLLDVAYMGSIFPKGTSVVSKKAIKYYPILGWFSKYYKGQEVISNRKIYLLFFFGNNSDFE